VRPNFLKNRGAEINAPNLAGPSITCAFVLEGLLGFVIKFAQPPVLKAGISSSKGKTLKKTSSQGSTTPSFFRAEGGLLRVHS